MGTFLMKTILIKNNIKSHDVLNGLNSKQISSEERLFMHTV